MSARTFIKKILICICFIFPVAIITCFYICWAPYYMFKLLFLIGTLTNKINRSLSRPCMYAYYVVEALFFINSLLNPFLYAFYCRRFKTSSKYLLRKIFNRVNCLFGVVGSQIRPNLDQNYELQTIT